MNIGDKIKFKSEGSDRVRGWLTESDGIPKKYIKHGSLRFLENLGEIVDKYDSYLIVKYMGVEGLEVQLAFKEENLELIEPSEPQYEIC